MEINPVIKSRILSQKTFRGRIVSDSMSPFIKTGDEVLIEVKASNLSRFDIIVFEMDGKLICHYIWSLNQIITPKLIQTRALTGARDVPISEESYIGKVISHRLGFWQRLKILLFQ